MFFWWIEWEKLLDEFFFENRMEKIVEPSILYFNLDEKHHLNDKRKTVYAYVCVHGEQVQRFRSALQELYLSHTL